mgnify:CR=1 FL=1
MHHYIGEPIVEYLECKGGTVFALDPWAMHAGNPKITSPGIHTQIRFTSMPPVTYYRDQNYLFKDNLDALIALIAPIEFLSMHGIWTKPLIGSHVNPKLCSIPISAAFSICIAVPPKAAVKPAAAIEQATPTSP